ncbi:NAD-binding protein [Romeria aff. gracilis LEGE 07310]|uniref:NAD-binding protein n=1 Tax=Vasconcelosia minhoensis LEGE 07310 TaxID=915328 RepID=A0A8J7A7Z3_9CYAN|nr:NAD-binding protein [Romeria gracilis]MBE9077710.1 NAD-binding protein [Romeria aff. gracilis LEGE 07310]
MQPQVIVCGLGRTGYRIFCLLREQGVRVAGISDRAMPHEADGDIVVGDSRIEQTLVQAEIYAAQTLVLASADDSINLAVLTQARLLNPRIRIINRLFNNQLGIRLDQTLPDHISMSVAALIAPIFAFAAMGNRAIGQLQIFDQIWPIIEEEITEQHPWRGRLITDIWEDLTRIYIAYQPAQGSTNLGAAIREGKVLQPGDMLILAQQPTVRRSQRSLKQSLRRFSSGIIQFRRRSRSVLLVLLALLVTIGVATTTYVSNETGTSVIDALYFSVGMITGAGGQEKVAENATAAIKLFTAIMMLVGAGVVGICYALLNDFILGTHLQHIWTVTRYPQSRHCIVCGLGGVGIRIVDQLKSLGDELIAIEHNPNGRFLGAARSRHIPIIIGDASVPETLQTANIEQADALLAVTSNDSINLEIAITAKSIAPSLPVFVRVHDPHFARQIQQVFEFDMVMSPTELAAPAFAAAAISGRIFGDCMTREGLWVAIATLITPNHPFHNRVLKEAAATEQFSPLYAEVKTKRVHGQALLEMVMLSDTVLYLMMPANRWENLWASRSERVLPITSENRLSPRPNLEIAE